MRVYDHEPGGHPRRRRPRAWTAGIVIAVAGGALFGVARGPSSPAPAQTVRAAAEHGSPAPPSAAPSAPPAAGTFRVPQPGDPEYADYQAMLKHPAFRSSLENTPGYAMPYDPEWRSLIIGRREAKPVSRELTGGAGGLADLAEQLVFAVRNADDALFLGLRVTREEYLEIFWPEFPQSRPYMKVPLDEAWFLQFVSMRDQMGQILTQHAERPWVLQRLEPGTAREFTNFRLHENVTVIARDEETGQAVRLVDGATLVERHGRWKFLMFLHPQPGANAS